ncbi:MAG: four helix bundle protein [Candidatus Kapaibacterium sp.]
MEKIRSHKDLEVWKKSVELVTNVYEISREFPKEEMYCMTNQIRRAAISIPSNIAEGAGRFHNKEFIQFLYISLGSCSELETQLIICSNLNFIDSSRLNSLTSKIFIIRRLLLGLIKSLKNQQ